MPRSENNSKNKSSMKTRSKRRLEEEKRKHNRNQSSDESDQEYSESEYDEQEMDMHEYQKFLSKIFPSKHLNEKIKAGKKSKQQVQEDSSEEEEEQPENKHTSKKEKSKKGKGKKENEKLLKRIKTQMIKEEEYTDEEEEEEEYSGDEEDAVEVLKELQDGNNKFNIIFHLGEDYYEEEDPDYYDEEDSDYITEDEEEDEEYFDEDEEYSDDEDEEENEEEDELEQPENDKINDKKSRVSKNKANKSSKEEEELDREEVVLAKFQSMAKELKKQHKDSKVVKDALNITKKAEKDLKSKRNKKDKKAKRKNATKFSKMLREKNIMNDMNFFRDKLSVKEQEKVIREMKEIQKISNIEKPYRLTLLDSTMSPKFKSIAMKKICSLRHMEPGGGEYWKIKNWVDTFMQLPFGKHKSLSIKKDDGVEKCHEFMESAKNTLDDAVYGLNDAKLQIMQMVGQWITNPQAMGNSIAIKGPMGTGKTTLVKEGISKILGRDFSFLALGGATDSSFLEGHSYTYEGSTWGKIVDILIHSKCMNPVIYFDELDKVSDTPKGEEIIGILTHLTDTSQNCEFHDKYFSEVDFDLSKCLFIFSYNDESKVNPILRDRMYRIHTKGYKKKEKIIIANKYLLPNIREQVMFTEEEIQIPNETMEYIIDSLTEDEEGVRNLKRCLEIIYTKLNLYRLMKPETNLFEEDMSLKVEFPFTVNKDIVDQLIKKTNEVGPPMGMYM